MSSYSTYQAQAVIRDKFALVTRRGFDPVNRMELFFCKYSILLFLAVGMTAFRATAQQPQAIFSHPPTSFSAEDDKFPKAVPLSSCIRRLLASDQDVANTLQYEHLSPDQLPEDWFTAAERDLGQNAGTYFVVMGAGLMRGANINPFWIFVLDSCRLLLSTGAHNLEVLKTETNGLPDVKIAAATAVSYFENQFTFDGHNYQEIKRTSQPIGEEVPDNLAGFETRKPLVQGSGRNPDSILCEARSWLWRQWWLEKPSYLTVTLYSKEGDKTTTTYFIRKVGSQLQVMIQTHKILVDRIPHPGARHSRVEDELVIAEDVERRWALKDNPGRRTNVPEGQEASSDSYELYFNDDSGNNLAIL
jgi:hypothetical protein